MPFDRVSHRKKFNFFIATRENKKLSPVHVTVLNTFVGKRVDEKRDSLECFM